MDRKTVLNKLDELFFSIVDVKEYDEEMDKLRLSVCHLDDNEIKSIKRYLNDKIDSNIKQ